MATTIDRPYETYLALTRTNLPPNHFEELEIRQLIADKAETIAALNVALAAARSILASAQKRYDEEKRKTEVGVGIHPLRPDEFPGGEPSDSVVATGPGDEKEDKMSATMLAEKPTSLRDSNEESLERDEVEVKFEEVDATVLDCEKEGGSEGDYDYDETPLYSIEDIIAARSMYP